MPNSPEYKYYFNNNLKITTASNRYTISGIGKNSSNVIKITAKDKAGNVGEKTVNVSTLVHSHTGNCYNGTVHTHTGNSSRGGGCYGNPSYHTHSAYGGSCYTYYSHLHTDSCYKVGTVIHYVNGVTGEHYIGCQTCGVRIDMAPDGCPDECSSTIVKHKSNCKVLNCSRTSGYSLTCGKSNSSVVGYSTNCGKTAGCYYKGNTRVYESCSNIVSKIEAVIPTQSVDRRRLDFSIKVTYLDGHSMITSPTSADYRSNKNYSNEKITLRYVGVNNKTGTTEEFTTTVTITTK